jgi:formylglycine-generating enzyme required for sulfatase activity
LLEGETLRDRRDAADADARPPGGTIRGRNRWSRRAPASIGPEPQAAVSPTSTGPIRSKMTPMRRLPGAPLLVCSILLFLGGAAPAAVRQTGTAPPAYQQSIEGTLVSFEMVRVPGGRATITDVGTARTVDVAPFSIGRTEVTWDMYDVFALGLDTPSGGDPIARPSNPYGAPDYGWGHAGFPVMSVTRAAAEAFCAWLSRKTGRAYRLPTEAEWALAASLASGGDGLDRTERAALAWWRETAGGRTHAVGTRAPDALGLFDLFGNTAEWVTTGSGALVTRGGSFRDDADAVDPGARAVQDPSWNETDPQLPKSRWWLSDAPFVGFRLASTPEGAQP